ncbi:MAG: NADH-quinone oxidoreductase subunit C [Spirochaetia bacterium]|jgi:Ni,Fe-hydrogenase III large subunit|nr:NADH-quinone oxidoreductase subunit C [Spirochaetia bacterium]
MKKIINGNSIPLSSIPLMEFDEFSSSIIKETASGKRISSYFGVQAGKKGQTDLFVILSDDKQNQLTAAKSVINGTSFPSITPKCPQAHLFEREISEQFGLKAQGHPWFKPVCFTSSWTGVDAWGRSDDDLILPAVGDFYRVEGEQVHEVAVGPVHAGVIEPGHFRFQCYGEEVYHLEIALGFQHRGVEKALIGGPNSRTLHYMETLAGDTTVGHTTSYCQIAEALSQTQISPRAQALRGIALELERLANHIGDLGALSGDVGYLPTASFCGRIRGELLNMTAVLCGSRFGRGMVRPGGTGFDAEPDRVADLLKRLAINEKEARDAINLLWENQSVLARFEDTGALSMEKAVELGIVGPPARAAGLSRDIRSTHPSGIFKFAQIPVSTCDSGDVFARAYVRWMEIGHSFSFIRNQLDSLPSGPVLTQPGQLAPESLAVSLNEGWRGEICHVGITDDKGLFVRYKVTDPSFHNWIALAQVLRNQEISDFPLCNKSFNLSYCGHDL